MGKKKGQKKSAQKSRGKKSAPQQTTGTGKKKTSLLPVYIIGGLLLAGVLASGMVAKIKRENKRWGEQCTKSSECTDGICFPDRKGINRCTLICNSDKTCPVGYKCVSQVHPKRRSLGMISICVEK
jgi:hypothetical protein